MTIVNNSINWPVNYTGQFMRSSVLCVVSETQLNTLLLSSFKDILLFLIFLVYDLPRKLGDAEIIHFTVCLAA